MKVFLIFTLVVCHGIPDSTILKNGDTINIDVTTNYKGFNGDTSAMALVGNVDEEIVKLVTNI